MFLFSILTPWTLFLPYGIQAAGKVFKTTLIKSIFLMCAFQQGKLYEHSDAVGPFEITSVHISVMNQLYFFLLFTESIMLMTIKKWQMTNSNSSNFTQNKTALVQKVILTHFPQAVYGICSSCCEESWLRTDHLDFLCHMCLFFILPFSVLRKDFRFPMRSKLFIFTVGY